MVAVSACISTACGSRVWVSDWGDMTDLPSQMESRRRGHNDGPCRLTRVCKLCILIRRLSLLSYKQNLKIICLTRYAHSSDLYRTNPKRGFRRLEAPPSTLGVTVTVPQARRSSRLGRIRSDRTPGMGRGLLV